MGSRLSIFDIRTSSKLASYLLSVIHCWKDLPRGARVAYVPTTACQGSSLMIWQITPFTGIASDLKSAE
jgi:hypothetical protein